MWVEKRATSLFNSFCSNVAKQAARFLFPVFTYLRTGVKGCSRIRRVLAKSRLLVVYVLKTTKSPVGKAARV